MEQAVNETKIYRERVKYREASRVTRELKQTTTARTTRTSPNKRFNEENNGSAHTLFYKIRYKIFYKIRYFLKALNDWPQGKLWVLFPRDPQCSLRQTRVEQHACKTSAHAQGLYFQNGGCECELHNKNAFFELKSNFISIQNFKAGNVKPPGTHWSKDF